MICLIHHKHAIIEDTSLVPRQMKLSATEQLQLGKIISTTVARNLLMHEVTKHFTVSSGANSIDLDAMFTRKIPNKIAIGMVRNDVFTGTKSLNPFNFQHLKLTSTHLVVYRNQMPSPGNELRLPEQPFCRSVPYVVWTGGSLSPRLG